jgi:hypothetical protein
MSGSPTYSCPRCKVAWQPGSAFCATCGIPYAQAWPQAAQPGATPPGFTWFRLDRLAVAAVVLVVVVVALLAALPRSSASPSSATSRPGGISPVSLSGSGSTNWGPRDFPAGLYSVAWEANGMCAFSVWLEAPDGSDRELAVNSVVADKAGRGTETARLSGGRYLVSVGADGCNWGLVVSSIQ